MIVSSLVSSGTCKLHTGEWYSGSFVKGKRQGLGRCIFSSGEKYIGQWHKDKRHGQGKALCPSGEKYSGMFLTIWSILSFKEQKHLPFFPADHDEIMVQLPLLGVRRALPFVGKVFQIQCTQGHLVNCVTLNQSFQESGRKE